MKYIVVKKKSIDHELPSTSGIWYVVRIKNPIIHFIIESFGFDYKPFRDKKEAIKCARLKSIGKYDYDIKYGKVWG